MAKSDLLEGTRNACQCPTCLFVFTSTSAFDKHRTGSFKDNSRRCMDKAEMTMKGLEIKPNGRWGAKFHGGTTKQQAMKGAK